MQASPALIGIGPAQAARKAPTRAGRTAAELDVAEINAAFCSQALAGVREVGMDLAICYIDGDGLAIAMVLQAI